jgi:dolichol kinase
MLTADMTTEQELSVLVARTEGLQPWRRVFHALNGLALAFLPVGLGLTRAAVVPVLALAFGALATLDLVRLRSPELNTAFFRAFRSLASPREAAGFASSTWYALGGLLSWALFPAADAVAAMLVLGLADPAASVVGRRMKGRRFGKGSVPGALTFFAVASGVLLFFASLPVALTVAALTALVEVIPWKLDDNLTVPLAVAVLVTLLAR